MRRHWKGRPFVFYGRLDFHKSGVAHIHAQVYGIELEELELWLLVVWPEVSETADVGDIGNRVHVEPTRSKRGALLYLAKPDRYAPADPYGLWKQRWWRCGEPEPFRSEIITGDIPDAVAVRMIRYMRRYLQIKVRDYPTLKAVVDPAQWMSLLAYELQRHELACGAHGAVAGPTD